MKKQHTTLEKIAPTVEEAITNGLEDLGLERERVDIEVLDEGTRGIFGLGSRMARIRLIVKEEEIEEVKSKDEVVQTIKTESELDYTDHGLVVERQLETETEEDVELDPIRETIEDLLELMQVDASVEVQYGEPDEERHRRPILVDIHGEDLSILIGKRAETLNALQYIASLIICKKLERPITLVVDVEGYRTRRQHQIQHLARQMADQAIKTGRRQVLEPMPANERRFIHIELRDDPRVRTESTGDEPHRKVNIIPVE